MTQPIQLWGAQTSRTLRPIWVAEELGVPYELTFFGPRTGETRSPEFTRLNPKQKIPFLVDGEFHLSESLAISRYLIDRYPTEAVYRPVTPADRAREDEWCCYIYGELDESALYVMRRHGDLGHIYGASSEVVSSAGRYAARHLDVIDRQMAGREFVLDGGFGLADVLLMTCLDWAVVYGLELPGDLPAYRQRISRRDAYRRATAVNFRQPHSPVEPNVEI